MKGSAKTGLNYLVIAMTAMFALVFAYALFYGGVQTAAYAEDSLHFVISFETPDIWILSSDNGELDRFQGDFFDPSQNDNVASVRFKRAIDSVVAGEGKDGYTLEFRLPDIGYSADGNREFDYTEKTGSFVIKGVYTPIISDDVIEFLQYRSSDAPDKEYKDYSNASELSGGLAFGENVDVGSYCVRFAIYEVFTFDGKPYSVPRYSSATSCTVRRAIPDAPDVAELSVEYGTRAADIANSISASEGSWRLSATQTEPSLADGETYLHVKDGAYRLNFDFTPYNPNYLTLSGVEVSVKITPRTLRIAVDDTFALAGQPLKTDVRFSVIDPLVGADKQEDLGIELIYDGVDPLAAGEYLVTARISNKDYVARSMNTTNLFLNGGLYTVYAATLFATAPDGVKFEVLLGSGFKGVALRVESANNKWGGDVNGFTDVTYRFIFEDKYHNRVYPSESYTVVWEDGYLIGAGYAGIVLYDGTALELALIKENHITVPANADTVTFFLRHGKPYADELSGGAIAGVTLGVLCALLIIALTAISAVKRRKPEMMKKYVYVRETDVLNVVSADKEDKSKDESKRESGEGDTL